MVRRRGSPAASSMCALPDDVVLEILSHLPAADRSVLCSSVLAACALGRLRALGRTDSWMSGLEAGGLPCRLSVVPCVCKRWQSLHSKPSKMWCSIYWESAMAPDNGRRLYAHMAFLRKRLTAIQDFEIGWDPVRTRGPASSFELHVCFLMLQRPSSTTSIVPCTTSARCHMSQPEAENTRHLKLQTCLALLSAAPDLRALSFRGYYPSNLPLEHASFVRMLSSLRMLHFESVLPEPGATTANQLIEPLAQGLCNLDNLSVMFEGAADMHHSCLAEMVVFSQRHEALFGNIVRKLRRWVIAWALCPSVINHDMFHCRGDQREDTRICNGAVRTHWLDAAAHRRAECAGHAAVWQVASGPVSCMPQPADASVQQLRRDSGPPRDRLHLGAHTRPAAVR